MISSMPRSINSFFSIMVITAISMGWFGNQCTMGSWCGPNPAAEEHHTRCCKESGKDSQSAGDHSTTFSKACCYGIVAVQTAIEPVTFVPAFDRVVILDAQHDSLASEPSTPPPRLSV